MLECQDYNLVMWSSIPFMDFVTLHLYGVDLSMVCNVGLLNASFKWQMISKYRESSV